ncbi:YbbR domain-containing protein [Pedobacter sp. CG_S7]|uniref:YbbR-like domain-containing protein n=1 Tax=Pedobacter sp. CG_S7 TaxID=3143930 RepID=UPI00339B0CA8
MPIIKLTNIERKRFLTLIACLFLAIAGWLFLALNNKYIYTAKTVLIYKNFPQKKAFHPLQSDTVDLMVEGTGWQLLFARLRIKPQSISISLEKLNNRNYILFSEQLYGVNNQLLTTQKIISVKPDTLYFDFSTRTVKKVPVELTANLEFNKQYGISSEIVISPNYVTVSGPLKELNKITSWKTDSLTYKGVQSSIKTRLAMNHSNFKNISIFPGNVEVMVPVDEFTEKTIEVPLKIINNREYLNVKLYPKKVTITFFVALSSYSMVTEDEIEAIVDMEEWKLSNHPQLQVRLTSFPNFCKLVKMSPEKVDFIIEK